MKRIAINGFGRIGRTFLRALLSDKTARSKIEVVAINLGPASIEHVAHMFKYDTLMGRYAGSVALEGNKLVVDGQAIALIRECDPCDVPWAEHGVDWVVESSGCFTDAKDARGHIKAGAKRVLITAPAREPDVTIIPGVNSEQFDPEKHTIVSLGSCTTNAIIPLAKVMHDAFGIVNGFMTSIHAYTNTQVLLDVEDGDLRRSRAAALNIIPTTTGAARLIGEVIPELDGRIGAKAIRVPVGKGSLINFVFQAETAVSVDAINQACTAAAQGPMAGVMTLTEDPVVSSDVCGDPHSVVVDTLLTNVHGSMAQVFGWYDNEWGYSMRVKDFLCAA